MRDVTLLRVVADHLLHAPYVHRAGAGGVGEDGRVADGMEWVIGQPVYGHRHQWRALVERDGGRPVRDASGPAEELDHDPRAEDVAADGCNHHLLVVKR